VARVVAWQQLYASSLRPVVEVEFFEVSVVVLAAVVVVVREGQWS
jgi:hypothetical protein